jgi:hypothetical protein
VASTTTSTFERQLVPKFKLGTNKNLLGTKLMQQKGSADSLSAEDLNSARGGIRTHAFRGRLRPERSALDRSATLAVVE